MELQIVKRIIFKYKLLFVKYISNGKTALILNYMNNLNNFFTCFYHLFKLVLPVSKTPNSRARLKYICRHFSPRKPVN